MPLTPSQQKAVNSSNEPLFIQAGAGTGKTFTLTKRIAHGLSQESGPVIGAVDRLLTITFTNKAAGELIGRIRQELRAQGLAEESLQIDAAWISTIHSMCKRMLFSHAFDAHIDPGANLLTQDVSNALSAMAMEILLDEETSPQLSLLLDFFGTESAVKLVLTISELLELAPNGADDFDLGPAASSNLQCECDMRNALATLMDARNRIEDEGLPEGKARYSQNHEKIIASIHMFEEALESFSNKGLAETHKALSGCPAISGGNLKEPYKTLFNECKVVLEQLRVNVASALSYELLEAAIRLAQKHLAIYRVLKARKGALDTNDLLISAYNMLDGHPEIAAAYQDAFDSIMVDEFQDTDSLQVGIVTKLCDESLSALATVGDAQQSIYGFRGADLDVYKGMRRFMQECGSNEVELTTNYRSDADILRFVEDVFAKPEFFGNEFLKVDSGRKEGSSPAWIADDEPRVKILLSAGRIPEGSKKRTVGKDKLRISDAVAVADEFERLHERGAPYGDMAILLASTKEAKAGFYLRELRSRGIPCIISGGSDFFLQPEVELVSMILRFLADPDDDEALFVLLGSNVFDVSDDDLLRLADAAKQTLRLKPMEPRTKPSLYDALQHLAQDDGAPCSEALKVARKTLATALTQKASLPMSSVVSNVVVASGWKQTLAMQGIEGGAVYANIERTYAWIDGFEELNGRSVTALSEYFVDLIDNAKSGNGANVKLGALASTGTDAVTIMTIHSSKGLEFPIVAVAEFEKQTKPQGASLISLSENGKRYLALGSLGKDVDGSVLASDQADPGSFAMAADIVQHRSHAVRLKAAKEKEEEQRLLYVALTRARDELIVVTHDGAFLSKGSLAAGLSADMLHAVFGEEIPNVSTAFTTGCGARIELQVTKVELEDEADEPHVDEEPPTKVAHSYAPAPPSFEMKAQIPKEPSTYSYSSIAKRGDASYEANAFNIALRDRTEDVETVSDVGSAFHLVAQWIAMMGAPSREAIDARMRSAAERYGLDEEARLRLAGAVAKWCASERFAQASSYPSIFSEYPFCVDVEGVSLEGSIDLACFDGEGGALVIDYKTGISGAHEELEDRYALQAACYSYALLASGMCGHMQIVFVRPEVDMEEVSYEYDKDDIEMLAAYILDASANPEAHA